MRESIDQEYTDNVTLHGSKRANEMKRDSTFCKLQGLYLCDLLSMIRYMKTRGDQQPTISAPGLDDEDDVEDGYNDDDEYNLNFDEDVHDFEYLKNTVGLRSDQLKFTSVKPAETLTKSGLKTDLKRGYEEFELYEEFYNQ